MDDPKDFKSRALPRVPLKLRVNMEFEKFSGFISEYSENISEGGMFIKTTKPKPMGSVFSLEFKLKDDYKLIQGWGEVVWVREKPEGNKPAGMGIKFLDLDEASTELIRSIVAIHKKEKKDDSIHPFDFMSEPQDEKKDDLSDIAKDVFENKKEEVSCIDEVFSSIESEIEEPEKPEPDEKRLDVSPDPEPEMPKEPPTARPAETQTEHPTKTSEDNTDNDDDSESSFVNEVFGDSDLDEEYPPPSDNKLSARTESVFDKEVYVRVSWYNRPTTLFTIVIALVVGFAIFVNYDKIKASSTIIVNFLNEYELLPFVDYEEMKDKESKIAQAPVIKPSVTPTTKETSKPESTQAAPKPTLKATALKSKGPKPPSRKIAKKIIPKKRVPRIKPSGINEIKLGKYGNGAMRISFELEDPAYGKKARGEYLSKGPRYLIKIPGINKPYKRHTYTISSPYLKRIRMGLHSNPDQMHIVFDLPKRTTKSLIKMAPTKDGLYVIFGRK